MVAHSLGYTRSHIGTVSLYSEVPAFSIRQSMQCLPQPEKYHRCHCSMHTHTEIASVVTRMVPTATSNTRMVRPLLCHMTHGTNSNWPIEPVSNEPGINPLSQFQNSIHNSQPALTTSLTSLICGTESSQLALSFSQ